MSIRDTLKNSIFDQKDESTTVPLSVRVPFHLNNELEELVLTLDKSKSFLLSEFIKAGVKEVNDMLEQDAKNPDIKSQNPFDEFVSIKSFMLNTNYTRDKNAHRDMLKNKEAAAFYDGWKEYICKLKEGDKVYLYQSGVGFVASGVVTGDLEKSEYKGTPEAKFSKKLDDFKVGFKAITAREFKELTDGGANFRMTMVSLSPKQASILDAEIDNRMSIISS